VPGRIYPFLHGSGERRTRIKIIGVCWPSRSGSNEVKVQVGQNSRAVKY
jgi:hypothetical protein